MKKQSLMIRNSLLLTTAISLPLLAGCSGQAVDSVAAFDRAQVKSDILPVAPDPAVVADSSRLLFDESDARYFVVKSADNKDDVCFIIYSTPESWSQSCSAGLPIEIEITGVTKAQLNNLSGHPSSDEWDQVVDNLALGK